MGMSLDRNIDWLAARQNYKTNSANILSTGGFANLVSCKVEPFWYIDGHKVCVIPRARADHFCLIGPSVLSTRRSRRKQLKIR
jgi:hypothetical protein